MYGSNPIVRNMIKNPSRIFNWIPIANIFICGATFAMIPRITFNIIIQANTGKTIRNARIKISLIKATIVVIRSVAELKAFYEQENEYDAPENYGKYNDAFFEEHAIVFVGQQLPSGSYRTRINYLTRSDNRLIVDYSTLLPPKSATVITNVVIWQRLLEVSKADLEGVTEIVPQYHEIQLAENEDYDESEWKQ